jgi:hypothetical protein
VVIQSTNSWSSFVMYARNDHVAWFRRSVPDESDAALARLESEAASIAPMSIAEVYAFRGQIDEAFEWLERAIGQKAILVTQAAFVQ